MAVESRAEGEAGALPEIASIVAPETLLTPLSNERTPRRRVLFSSPHENKCGEEGEGHQEKETEDRIQTTQSSRLSERTSFFLRFDDTPEAHEHPWEDDSNNEPGLPSVDVVFVSAVVIGTAALIAHDLCFGGLGNKNGKAVSFLDSLNNCRGYRDQTRLVELKYMSTLKRGISGRVFRGASLFEVTNAKNSWAWRLKVLVMCTVVKFGGGTVVSLLLKQTPAILQGPRHYISFLVGLALIQFCPEDYVFYHIKSDSRVRAIIGVGVALYKLRKLNYVIDNSLQSSLWLAFLLAIFVVDGSTIFRTLTSLSTLSRKHFKVSLRGMALEFGDVCKDFVILVAPTMACVCALRWTHSFGIVGVDVLRDYAAKWLTMLRLVHYNLWRDMERLLPVAYLKVAWAFVVAIIVTCSNVG